MEPVAINYLAVIVAAVAYSVLGVLWYSPVLFGSAWLKGIGKTKEQMAGGPVVLNYVIGFICAFLASYGIARIMLWTGRNSIAEGIVIGLLAGVCFVVATMLMNDLFERRSKGLTAVNVLYHLLGLIVAGIIVGAWR
ncbi:MAG: DUF1761 domain-containing protein [Candidatus Zixiibacteriota bacterium]|nr:MAG: DUF1761 domain-containing protein [candidate division Zixibacteria bacterium]